MKRLESLQALRGLGALAIMAYHYRYFFQDGDNAIRQLLDALLSKAIVGVDLFLF
jgi:peptidoglycan/LPS O-acetylase OafA/YrhL